MKNASGNHPWPPPSLEDWCAEVDEDPEDSWLLKDLIPTDSVTVISGPAKRGFKTWLAFQLVRLIASGKEYGPLITVGGPRKVLVLEAEGARKPTRSRWQMLANSGGWEIPPGQVLFAHRYPILLSDPVWVNRVAALIEEAEIDFVLIDTLAKSFRGDENNAEAAGDMMRALDVLRNAGAAVSYIHHVRKSQKGAATDIDEDLRGSSAIPGFYDVHIALRPVEGGLSMTVRQRDGEEQLFSVWWEFNGPENSAQLYMERELEVDA